jgi:hypothetical protein
MISATAFTRAVATASCCAIRSSTYNDILYSNAYADWAIATQMSGIGTGVLPEEVYVCPLTVMQPERELLR